MKIGIIAGAGQFPLLVAQEARRRGLEPVGLGIQGVTDPKLAESGVLVHTFKLGQLDKPIQLLKELGVRQAVMAGKVEHRSIFGGILPDFRAVKLLAGLKDRKTDTILAAVAAEFSKEGIDLLNSAAYLSHLLAEKGCLTRRRPSPEETADAELGWQAAKALSILDIGQTVVVSSGAIVAVEAMEGTDGCIRRAGEIVRSLGCDGRLVVVKAAGPKQDFRFDLPVVGLDTLECLGRAGGGALAVEAGKTLLFDKEEFLKSADGQGVAVLGL